MAQKYVNSPDSDIYHKDHELYGIYQAKKSISKEDRVYMVEGYTDVIAMHQCGIENVVANSGTALSVYQIKLLRRFTQNVTLLYDGDEAGIHAALRGTDMMLEEGMNVKVLLLPKDEDPDSFARKNTAEQFRQYIKEHEQDFLVFKTEYLLKGVTDPIQRSQAIIDIIGSIAVIKDQIVRATYVQECARRIGIHESALIAEMNKIIERNIDNRNKLQQRTQQPAQTPTAPPNPQALKPHTQPFRPKVEDEVERCIIQQVIRKGELIVVTAEENADADTQGALNVAQYIYQSLSIDELSFSNPLYNTILKEAVEQSNNPDFKAENYFTRHPDINISSLAAQLVTEEYTLSERLKMELTEQSLLVMVDHLLLDFRLRYVNNKMKQLQLHLSQCMDDEEETDKTLQSILQLQTLRNAIAKRLGRNFM